MKKIDYAEYRHSYAHFLQPKLKSLNYAANVAKKPVCYLRKIVSNALSDPEIRWTEKEQSFYSCVMGLDDSRAIYYYCKNAVGKAKEIEVMVDDKGELI